MFINGKEVFVDPEFEPLLKRLHWYIKKNRNCEYVITTGVFGNKQRGILMHRLLTGFSKLQVDHVNGNGLDNRLCNLRLCSIAENHWNTRRQKKNKSGFRGVSPVSKYGTWYAQARVKGKNNHLGSFKTPEEAARAYDTFVRREHGQFARTNFAD